MSEPHTFYTKKLSELENSVKSLRAEVYRLSWARVFLFLFSVIALVYFANGRNGSGVFLVVAIFPFAFGLLVRYFNRKSDLLRFLEDQIGFCTDELDRLALRLKNLDGGEEFTDRSHPYSYDLDLFGRHSLFKLINRSHTPDGRLKMRDWMLSPARPEQILERQGSVEELSKRPSWLISFLSSSRSVKGKNYQTDQLKSWLQTEEGIKPSSIMLIAGVLSPILLLGTLVGIIWLGWPIYAALPFLIINGILLSRVQETMKSVNEQTSGNVRLLRSYESMIHLLLQEKFESEKMRSIISPFGERSVQAIRSLRKLLDFMDGRGNMFYAVFNLIFLLDIWILNRLRKWKKNNVEDISKWFDHLAEAEVLSSLAAHAYLHPSCIMPEISEPWELHAIEIGHPLIDPAENVTNTFDLSGKGAVAIITGSNMSGKSTFLRTVGVNVVLGSMGSVVHAKAMKLPVVQLFTGMRTEDDLSSHISSFYAELKRIKSMLEMIRDSQMPVLFMLDEILKGTNTKDRHRGSEGLVNQLSRLNSFGFVSTHDLSLGSLERENSKIRNYSFNSRIEGDEIIFDYKIEQGICHSFNASKLMEIMGIELSE